jgi:aarF domain-containing kinase
MISDILLDVTNMVRDHHVKLAGEFANILVSIFILEGVGRQLNPDLDLIKVAVPILRQVSRKSMETGQDVFGQQVSWASLVSLWVGAELLETVVNSLEWMEQEQTSDFYLPDL